MENDASATGDMTVNGDSEAYARWLEKFKRKKTTDDCHTPPKVYDAVLAWVRKRYGIPADAPIVRPFPWRRLSGVRLSAGVRGHRQSAVLDVHAGDPPLHGEGYPVLPVFKRTDTASSDVVERVRVCDGGCRRSCHRGAGQIPECGGGEHRVCHHHGRERGGMRPGPCSGDKDCDGGGRRKDPQWSSRNASSRHRWPR